MLFYDNQLELDETSQLPFAHVSTIRFDSNDSSRAWLGCSDGAVYRVNTESLQADRQFAHEQCVADLVASDGYLLCLSQNYVKLFDIQQLNSQSSKCDHVPNEWRSTQNKKRRKRCLNGELKCGSAKKRFAESSSHLVKLGSHSALSCLCAFDKDQFLLGGAQSDLLLFDANQLKVVNKFPLHLLDLTSASSCTKMRRIGSRNLIATSTMGGRMFIHDRNTLKPIMTFKPFTFASTDFDVIGDNYILSTGSNSSYSSTEKTLSIFDLRVNRELAWRDDSRFYQVNFVRSLPNCKANNLLTLDRNGSCELMQIENEKSFVCSGKRFTIPLQSNASICAYDIDSTADILLTADRNGYLHRSLLKSVEPQPTYCLSSYPIMESKQLTTKHVRIDDIPVRPGEDQSETIEESPDESSGCSVNEIKRSFKIETHNFLNYRSLIFGFSNPFQDFTLKDITQATRM